MHWKTWIKHRYKQGLPLNTKEVERCNPEILQEVFSGSAPLGWRRALLAAGVDIYKIDIHIEETIECQVCGKHLSVLGSHLKACHGMTSEDYLEEYPGAPLASESYQASHSQMNNILNISHWEPLWSAYYALDWVLLLQEKGEPLNYNNIATVAKALTCTIFKFWESWDNALRTLQIDPHETRLNSEEQTHWDKQKVLEELKLFVKRRKQDPNFSISHDYALSNSIRRYFGNTGNAVKAANLNLSNIQTRPAKLPQFPKETLQTIIREFKHAETLLGQDRAQRKREIHDTHKHLIRRHYPNFPSFLKKNTLPKAWADFTPYINKQDVEYGLDTLEAQKGTILTLNDLFEADRPLYDIVTSKGWGKQRLKSKQAIVQENATKKRIFHELYILQKEGIPLDLKNIRRKHPELYQVIQENDFSLDSIPDQIPPPKKKLKFPNFDPKSPRLRDQIIFYRKTLNLSKELAAKRLEIPVKLLRSIERGQINTDLQPEQKEFIFTEILKFRPT